MDILVEIYNKMRRLRECGVKMKDMAEQTDITSSVLSSLYSTVLPTYVNAVSTGTDAEEALDAALEMVNNVSKKKLLSTMDGLAEKLNSIEPRLISPFGNDRPFFDDIENEAAKYIPNVANYSGAYLGYSRSSYKDGLKVEPYLISSIQDGELMPKVYCANAAGQIYTGVGMFSAHQIGYLFFNEQKRLQIGLKVIYLQLPMFDNPNVLKGIYLSHDYNRNPVARRIVLIKQSEDTSLEDFRQQQMRLIPVAELNEAEQFYYNYTSQPGDYIKSFMVASPEGALEDLVTEKKILDVF